MPGHMVYRSFAYGLGKDDAAFFEWRVSRPVLHGHDVWAGHGAVVPPWVIVTRDVAAFTVVAGNPARPLRPRF